MKRKVSRRLGDSGTAGDSEVPALGDLHVNNLLQCTLRDGANIINISSIYISLHIIKIGLTFYLHHPDHGGSVGDLDLKDAGCDQRPLFVQPSMIWLITLALLSTLRVL